MGLPAGVGAGGDEVEEEGALEELADGPEAGTLEVGEVEGTVGEDGTGVVEAAGVEAGDVVGEDTGVVFGGEDVGDLGEADGTVVLGELTGAVDGDFVVGGEASGPGTG